MSINTTQRRNNALDRLRNVNRGVVIVSVALTALFAEAAAQAFPGKKHTSTAPKKTAPAPSSQGSTSAPLAPNQAPESSGQAPESSSPSPESSAPSEQPAPESSAGSAGSSEAEAPVVSGG